MAAYFPTTLFAPGAIRLPLSRSLRLEMEQAIESAIAFLDQLDGDPDLEDDELDDDGLGDGEALNYCEDALVYGLDQSKGPVNILCNGM